MVLNLDFDTVLLWILVGLVAGFFASHLALGHGLGLVGDVIAGVVGALVGGFLAGVFHWSITIVGHPILSAMLIAFIGAVIVLMVLRVFNASGIRRRAYGSRAGAPDRWRHGAAPGLQAPVAVDRPGMPSRN